MISKITFIALILFSNSLFSQDCDGLKNNEVTRLDSPGGPLFQSPVQDQDGVGTCYANAASIGLQTAIPGNPQVSYLQLAFNYADKQNLVNQESLNQDSAYAMNSDGSKANVLIHGGFVCESILSAQKGNGVCKREDVALEKILFNPKSGSLKDDERIQEKVILAMSSYYDAIKDNFGSTPKLAKKEIAKRIENFNDFKLGFNNLIQEKQNSFLRDECLKDDTKNSETVMKNILAKIYEYLKNANYSPDQLNNPKKLKNPSDKALFYFNIRNGTPIATSSWVSNNNSEINFQLNAEFKNQLNNEYLANLKSNTPDKSGTDAFVNSMNKLVGKSIPKEVFDRFFKDLSPSDKDLLERDFNRYAKKEIDECIYKKKSAYFISPNGFLKDFNETNCLSNNKTIGIQFSKLASVLDESNYFNIETLNNFINNLPNMSYEEAMRALVAPECQTSKMIKVPKNLNCQNYSFRYSSELEEYILREKLISENDLEKEIELEKAREKLKIEADILADIKKLDDSVKYKKIGTNEVEAELLKLKAQDIEKLNKEKARRIAAVAVVAKNNVMKKIAGIKEQEIWNAYQSESKRKFSNDTLRLLKENKQAIPMSICTRLFTEPSVMTQREGKCEQDVSKENDYANVGGYHAVTIVGARCINGKKSYLMQNSWGDWNSLKSIKDSDGKQHFEHEFGKAWIDENELINNTFDYQKISNK